MGLVSCEGKTHGRREKHPVSAEPSALKIAQTQREVGHSLTCHSPARSQADMALEKLTTSGVRPLVLMLISRSSACSHLHEVAPTRGRSRRNRRFTLSEARQEEEQRGSGASSTGREKDERQEPCRFMRPVTSFACALVRPGSPRPCAFSGFSTSSSLIQTHQNARTCDSAPAQSSQSFVVRQQTIREPYLSKWFSAYRPPLATALMAPLKLNRSGGTVEPSCSISDSSDMACCHLAARPHAEIALLKE